MPNEIEEGDVKEAVIDKVQEMYEQAKKELEKAQCPEHGKALKELSFDRSNGRFKIETCCDNGEKPVNDAIVNI